MKICNLYDTLLNTAINFPEKEGISDEKESITFSELLKRVDCLANYFSKEIGVRKGDRVGLMMLNSNYYVAAVYAIAKIGAQVVLVNVKLHAKEIAFLLTDTQVKYLILQADLWERVAPEVEKTDVQTLILDAVVMFEQMEKYQVYNLVEGMQYESRDEIKCQIKRDDIMAILYTSGTSGEPKGVELTHEAILQTVLSYKNILQLNENQSTLLAVPLFHVTGFSCIMAVFIAIGGFMKILPSFHSKRSLQIMSEYKIKHFHAVPTIYKMLVNGMTPEYDLSNLESAVCGGGYIEDELIKTFSTMAPNVAFHPAYGMTETAGGGVLFPSSYLQEQKHGSAGKVMSNCEIIILDEQGRELPIGKIGEISFKGSMIITEYLHKKSKHCFMDGWLKSGDLGRLDQDNYVYIVGRVRSMVNRGGEKIYPRFVEKEICLYPKVNQCMVFPVKDDLFGEVPGCVIVCNQGETMSEKEIRTFLQGRIQSTKIPEYIEFWDQLPNTASGKVRVAYLTQLFTEKYCGSKGEKK